MHLLLGNFILQAKKKNDSFMKSTLTFGLMVVANKPLGLGM
jgi:hypothetical protein